MKKKKKDLKGLLLAALACSITIAFVLGAIFIVVYACGLCWEYSLNTWLEIADSPNRIELWQGMLISCIPAFGQISIPFAIFTWIASLFFT